MPVIEALGLRWQIASDFIPILAAWGLLSHFVWFIIVGVLFLISKPSDCAPDHGTNANLYESVVDGTLAIFAFTMLIEVVLIFIGLRGKLAACMRSCNPCTSCNDVFRGCRRSASDAMNAEKHRATARGAHAA